MNENEVIEVQSCQIVNILC